MHHILAYAERKVICYKTEADLAAALFRTATKPWMVNTEHTNHEPRGNSDGKDVWNFPSEAHMRIDLMPKTECSRSSQRLRSRLRSYD